MSLTLYEDVADRMQTLIEEGTLRAGDRIPSVRRLHRQWSVSMTTVLEAYRLLEDRGCIGPFREDLTVREVEGVSGRLLEGLLAGEAETQALGGVLVLARVIDLAFCKHKRHGIRVIR